MSNLVTFNNQNIELINHNNQLYMTVPQIEGALEFAVKGKAVSNIYNNHKEEFTPEMTTLIKVGRTRQRIFNREGCWLIGMFARTPKAMEFRRWVLDALGEQYNLKSMLFDEDWFGVLKKFIKTWTRDAVESGFDRKIKPQNKELVSWCSEILSLIIENRLKMMCEDRFDLAKQQVIQVLDNTLQQVHQNLDKALSYEQMKLENKIKDMLVEELNKDGVVYEQ